MCDITKPEPAIEPNVEQYVADLKADWHALARYSVIRTQYHPGKGKSRSVVATSLPYGEAKARADAEDARIRTEPGYRSGCMGNPLAILELEAPEETYSAFRGARAARQRRHH